MLNFRGVLIFFPVHWYVEHNMASWKITSFSRRHILKWFVFHCHASFWGCISWIYFPHAGFFLVTTEYYITFGFRNPYKHPSVAGRMDGGIDPRYIFGSKNLAKNHLNFSAPLHPLVWLLQLKISGAEAAEVAKIGFFNSVSVVQFQAFINTTPSKRKTTRNSKLRHFSVCSL